MSSGPQPVLANDTDLDTPERSDSVASVSVAIEDPAEQSSSAAIETMPLAETSADRSISPSVSPLPSGQDLLRRATAFNEASQSLAEALAAVSGALRVQPSRQPSASLVFHAVLDTRLAFVTLQSEFRRSFKPCSKIIFSVSSAFERPQNLPIHIKSVLESLTAVRLQSEKTCIAIKGFADSWQQLRQDILTPPPRPPFLSRILRFLGRKENKETKWRRVLDDLCTAVDKLLPAYVDRYNDFKLYFRLWDGLDTVSMRKALSSDKEVVVSDWDMGTQWNNCQENAQAILLRVKDAMPPLQYPT